MGRWTGWMALRAAALLSAGCASSTHTDAAAGPAAGDAGSKDATRSSLDRMPVSFVANDGRWDRRA